MKTVVVAFVSFASSCVKLLMFVHGDRALQPYVDDVHAKLEALLAAFHQAPAPAQAPAATTFPPVPPAAG